MTTIHCGQKFAIHNVFKTLFITRSTTIKRKISTAPQKLLDYNKLLKSHAKTFKKQDSGQKEAIKILQEMKLHGIQPNSQTWFQLVIGMSFQRHRTHAQNDRLEAWFNNLVASEPKIEKFKKVLFHLSFQGHPNLLEMFTKMNNKAELQVEDWHAAIKGCIKAKKMEDANVLLEMLRKNKMATISSYRLLIESYLYLQDGASASQIFSFMLQDEITANYEIYELFIDHYMSLEYVPDHANTLIKLWQAVLMTKTETNIPQEMIQKYLSYFGQHGELAKAEQVYLDVKAGRLSRRCVGELNKVIIGFSNKRQLRSALSLYYDLLGQGYKPSQNVINKISEACLATGDKEAIQQLIDVTNAYHKIKL
ncbi:uncharacterized protein EV154DRAFT_493327 [Mucor mucedo]|uniref:uncharacterized protein n=1 Tax=Mucor mucedo TaxID=29922 RepID=UPI00221E4CE7|nr:uncharacterized protein EV154DRAFT_493327 [Mucor mucedo]KAI7896041.1 hypothetical protein EV154DRAFT_493327 [Mucor mucedo]